MTAWCLIVAVLLAALVALQWFWQRRFAQARQELLRQEQFLAAQQQQRQKTLAEKQAQQEALFNSMAEGVLVLNAAGRIELINQSLQRLLAPAGDVRGQT